uniref:Uncharacterized protein n=1 Tax=Lutzomyia longipalpis TaxID=7200 RepID=A0A7G3B2G0_LUTLO
MSILFSRYSNNVSSLVNHLNQTLLHCPQRDCYFHIFYFFISFMLFECFLCMFSFHTNTLIVNINCVVYGSTLTILFLLHISHKISKVSLHLLTLKKNAAFIDIFLHDGFLGGSLLFFYLNKMYYVLFCSMIYTTNTFFCFHYR